MNEKEAERIKSTHPEYFENEWTESEEVDLNG